MYNIMSVSIENTSIDHLSVIMSAIDHVTTLFRLVLKHKYVWKASAYPYLQILELVYESTLLAYLDFFVRRNEEFVVLHGKSL